MVARICSRSSSRPVWSGSREANVAASDPGGSSGPSRCAFCRTTVANARGRRPLGQPQVRLQTGRADPLQLVDQPPRVGQHRLQLVAPTRPAQVRRQPRPQVRLARRAGPPTRRRAGAGPGGRRPPPRPTRPAAPGWCRAGRRGSRRAAPAGRGRAGSRPAARGRTAADTTGGPETRVQPPVCAHSRATTSPGIATSSPNTASSRYRACSSGVNRRRLTSIVAATAALRSPGLVASSAVTPSVFSAASTSASSAAGSPPSRTASRTAPCTSASNTGHRPVARNASATSAGGSAGRPAVSSSWACSPVI